MVALSEILSFNAQIHSSFPPGPVALFVGATSGIGAATLKAFAKYTVTPKAYFVGRSQEAADKIIAECQALNPEGQYIFIAADVSLIKVVDGVCAQIQAREPYLNILFLSQGVARFDRPGNFCSLSLLAQNIPYSYPHPLPGHLTTITGADFYHSQ
jgi:NAD(P)-dependent dehydrogenase (short-subunit alcohol dehydrogenase family)